MCWALVFDSVSLQLLLVLPLLLRQIFVTHHLCHTIFHHTHHLSHTIFVTHHLCPTNLGHTIFHTPFTYHLCHTPSFTHPIFHTPSLSHHLSHTLSFTHTHHLCHTIFVTHTPSFTYYLASHHLSHTIFATHHLSYTIFVTHHLCHTIFHTHTHTHYLSHTHTHHLSHTTFHTQHLCFAWQAWHLRLWWRAWARLVTGDAAALCVAGVALGDIHLRFAWQVWHLEASTFVLRGRGGTYGTGLALVVAGDASTLRGLATRSPVTPPHFAWQGATWRHPPSLRVAGVALGAIDVRFGWQAWHLWHWAGSGSALGRRPSGTRRHPPSFRVAGMALGGIHLRFAWQGWPLFVALGWLWWRAWPRLVADDTTALCAAGVALGDTVAGDAAALCVAGGHLATSTFASCGRRGTWSHRRSFWVAGVALMALGLFLVLSQCTGWLWLCSLISHARPATHVVYLGKHFSFEVQQPESQFPLAVCDMISGEKRDGADQNGSTELGMGWYGSIFGSCDMHARMIKLVGEHRQSVEESVFRMSAMATGRYQHETTPFSSGWKGPPVWWPKWCNGPVVYPFCGNCTHQD